MSDHKTLILMPHGHEHIDATREGLDEIGAGDTFFLGGQLLNTVGPVNAILHAPGYKMMETADVLRFCHDNTQKPVLIQEPYVSQIPEPNARALFRSLSDQWASVCFVSHEAAINKLKHAIAPEAGNFFAQPGTALVAQFNSVHWADICPESLDNTNVLTGKYDEPRVLRKGAPAQNGVSV